MSNNINYNQNNLTPTQTQQADITIQATPVYGRPVSRAPIAPSTQSLSATQFYKDSFALNWAGQMIDTLVNDEHYYGKPIDFSFDPFANGYINGYETYAKEFTDVVNEKHADNIKEKINRNTARRARVAKEDSLLMHLSTGFFDPLTYIIPGSWFARGGVSYSMRAIKSGAATGLAVGATEPIRQAIDPTATLEEGVAMIGASALAGGFIGGFLGRNTLARPNDFPKDKIFNDAVHKTVKKKTGGTMAQNIQKFFRAHTEAEGKIYWEDSKITVPLPKIDLNLNLLAPNATLQMKGNKDIGKGNVRAGQINERLKDPAEFKIGDKVNLVDEEGSLVNAKPVTIKKFLSEDYVETSLSKTGFRIDRLQRIAPKVKQKNASYVTKYKTIKEINFRRELIGALENGVKNIVRGKTPTGKKAYYNDSEKTIYVDTDAIEADFPNAPWTKPTINGVVPFAKNAFTTKEEWSEFVTLHEFMHNQFRPQDLGFKKNYKSNNKEYAGYENKINELAYDKLKNKKNNFVNVNDKNPKNVYLEIDPNYAHYLYHQKNAQIFGANGQPYAKNIISDFDDFVAFHARKEIYKHQYGVAFKKYTDGELNDYVLAEWINGLQANRTTKVNRFIKGFVNALESISPGISMLNNLPKLLGKAGSQHKPYIETNLFRLAGDDATMTKAVELGVASGNSVTTAIHAQHIVRYNEYKTTMQNLYDGYRDIDPNTNVYKAYLTRGVLGLGDAIKRKVQKGEYQQQHIQEREFFENITFFQMFPDKLKEGAQLMDSEYVLDKVEVALLKKAIKNNKTFYDEWQSKLSEYKMFANNNSVDEFINIKTEQLNAYQRFVDTTNAAIAKGTKKQSEVQDALDEAKKTINRLDDEIEAQPKYRDFESTESQIENYTPRHWLMSKVQENPDDFAERIGKQWKANPEQQRAEINYMTRKHIAQKFKAKKNTDSYKRFMKIFGYKPQILVKQDDVTFDYQLGRQEIFIEAEKFAKDLLAQHTLSTKAADSKVVQSFYNKLFIEEIRTGDLDSISGLAKNSLRDLDTNYAVGTKYLLSRRKLDPEFFYDYMDLNADRLSDSYYKQNVSAFEIAKEFGDQHLIQFNNDLKLKLLYDNVPIDNIARILNVFTDIKNQILGTSLTQPVTAMSRQTASIIRDTGTYTSMGKATIAATVDVAMLPLVHGFGNTYKAIIGPYLKSLSIFQKNSDYLKRFQPLPENMGLNSSVNRVVDQANATTEAGRTAGIIGTVNQAGQAMRVPYFIANLLTPWTAKMKELVQKVSMNRFIEDSYLWANGKANEFERNRLLSYGIDEKTAKLIASMPIEKEGDLFFANDLMWDSVKGGDLARTKLQTALYNDTQRTIITPSILDKPNMMTGVLRVSSKEWSEMLETNPAFRKFAKKLGYTKENMGGKFSNAYMGLLLQFYTWSIGANRRLLISNLQDRQVNRLGGITALISMGMFSDSWKTGSFYDQKPLDEKILRGIELSGVTGYLSDINALVEDVSQGVGMSHERMGVRPFLGMEPRMSHQSGVDAAGNLIGAGPSKFLDLLYGITSDNLTHNEKMNILRRSIPLNNLWFLDSGFKKVFSYGMN